MGLIRDIGKVRIGQNLIYNGFKFLATTSTIIPSGIKAINCQGWTTSFPFK